MNTTAGIALSGIILLTSAAAYAQEDTDQDVFAGASDDTGIDALGRLYTATFNPIRGTSSILPPNASAVRTVRRATTDRLLRVVESASELAANARVWGLGSASARSDQTERHAVYRAYAVDSITMIDDSFTVENAPPGAEWYISAVYVGRLIEVHFWSTSQSLSGQISATGTVGSGSIAGFASERSLQYQIRTVGLEPRGGDALFASTPADIRRAYRETGEPTAVLIRFSRVPRSAHPQDVGPRRSRVVLTHISFPERKPTGTSWDAFGGRPDIMVRVSQNGTTLLDRFVGQDILEANTEFVIGDSLLVSSESPLTFQFTDRDVANNDDAGQLVVDALEPPGSTMRVTASGGVRVVLRVEQAR